MQTQAGPLVALFPWILIFAVFYFLLIRPQQKRAKEHQQMLNNLKKGDKILTSGGIYGTIVGIKGNTLEVEIAEEVDQGKNKKFDNVDNMIKELN